MNSGMMSSKTCEWPTPADLFARIVAEFGHLDLDVCADQINAKCANYFTKEQNGLAQAWAPRKCWMNPPYGREIKEWMRKAYLESQRGAFVVCLVPARTDTEWWHEYAMKGKIRFLRGRIKFVGARHGAPFPSAIVVFKPNTEGRTA